MKKFCIAYAFTGGVTIEAKTIKQALAKFEQYSESELYENANPVEITETFEVGDD